MMEEAMVIHCAPTLAALSTGNLFTISCAESEWKESLERLNSTLNRKGVLVRCLRWRNGRALIYVFRPKKLWQDWKQDGVMEFLLQNGYRRDTLCGMIEQLSQRIGQDGEFPHEIGLFLGYPLADVVGFIEHRGTQFKYSGYWKVYENETAARILFEKIRKCKQLYCRRFMRGMSVGQLAAAA